ncbi:MAG TPA: cation:proton antiporter [Jiangellales bacterium]|nr:cation:proton antiporter [Jiangellales bacterium]
MEATAEVVYVTMGVGLMLAAVLPRLLAGRPFSPAIAFVAVGAVAGLLPLPLPEIAPATERVVTERLTEVCVIVALMGVGLALDRPVGWRRWSSTWRLLGIAMPLSIAGVALLGWGLAGLAPASALLLGAALAPTDPVLASDVQVGEPGAEQEDEARFALTSEAGLNDGLAFPFVYAAVFLAGGPFSEWGLHWLAWELVAKVVIGVAVGVAAGWVMARVVFGARRRVLRLAETAEPVIALAAVFLSYGVAEVVGGYGFLAVFVSALVLRDYERTHEYHGVLHGFLEHIERLLTLALLLLLGHACATGMLDDLTWRGALVGVLLVAVVRPVAGWVAMAGGPGTRPERAAVAFFGVRGIGSFYYLAYATGEATFPGDGELWSTVAFTVLVSVVVHGVTAAPVVNRLDDART